MTQVEETSLQVKLERLNVELARQTAESQQIEAEKAQHEAELRVAELQRLLQKSERERRAMQLQLHQAIRGRVFPPEFLAPSRVP